MIQLTGTTWDHSRGFIPVVAAAQRFSELNDKVEIRWSKRSLQEFADEPLDKLAEKFDLLVIDHPWIGHIAQNEVLTPLEEYLSAEFLDDQAQHSVGKSFESYASNNRQWAIPVDAAAPVASSRPDLLDALDVDLPQTFDELIELAQNGWVAFPGIPIDSLMNFYMFCIAFGEDPFSIDGKVVSQKVGVKALQALRKLAKRIDPACFEWNPIKLYEAMTQGDDIAYCPFAYGYVNYTRRGYARKPLHFHDLITITRKSTPKLKTTLGGTGLAISKYCKHKAIAAEYVAYTASAQFQRTLYFESGGQPGHREAWTDTQTNDVSNNFFKSTLPALDRAFVRPRYDGYLYFQDHAGFPIRNYMMKGGDEEAVLKKLNYLYRESLK